MVALPIAPTLTGTPVLRSRLRAASFAGALALSLVLSACGSEEPAEPEGAGFDSLTIEGDFGKKVDVTFDGRLAGGEPQVEVLKKGDGKALAMGDTALAYWWVGNGFTEQEAVNAFEGSTTAIPVSENTFPGLVSALEGQTVGSRVAVVASATEAFGELGNPQMGIGNKDSTVIVVDIMGSLLNGPEGADKKPAAWAPKIVEKDGLVSEFDFAGVAKPTGKLRITTLVQGEGAKVKKGQTLHANYLGQVYKAKKPFDESYSKSAASFPIGVGRVVEGWDETLVGQNVGSRVIIEIPPAKGYGKKGNEGAGIKGTDTLYFVVDILGAA